MFEKWCSFFDTGPNIYSMHWPAFPPQKFLDSFATCLLAYRRAFRALLKTRAQLRQQIGKASWYVKLLSWEQLTKFLATIELNHWAFFNSIWRIKEPTGRREVRILKRPPTSNVLIAGNALCGPDILNRKDWKWQKRDFYYLVKNMSRGTWLIWIVMCVILSNSTAFVDSSMSTGSSPGLVKAK